MNFQLSVLRRREAKKVAAPRVLEAPVSFECELLQIVPIGEGPFAANLIIGKIVLLHVDDAVLNDKGKIDPQLIDVVGRMGGLDYTHTRDRFPLPPAQAD